MCNALLSLDRLSFVCAVRETDVVGIDEGSDGKERSVPLPLNEINARSRQRIALILEILVVPGIQWVQFGTHMHLATVERVVSSSLDEFSKGIVIDLRWNAGLESVVQHAESTGHDASRHADPAGDADGVGHISVGKPDTVSSQAVHRRRVEELVAGAAHHRRMLLIGDDQQDIGPPFLRPRTRQRNKTNDR